jgi:hypothetical protein
MCPRRRSEGWEDLVERFGLSGEVQIEAKL